LHGLEAPKNTSDNSVNAGPLQGRFRIYDAREVGNRTYMKQLLTLHYVLALCVEDPQDLFFVLYSKS
jgi:hypothetical protein